MTMPTSVSDAGVYNFIVYTKASSNQFQKLSVKVTLTDACVDEKVSLVSIGDILHSVIIESPLIRTPNPLISGIF